MNKGFIPSYLSIISVFLFSCSQITADNLPVNSEESIFTVIDRIEKYSQNPLKWPSLHYAISQGYFEDALVILKLYPEQASVYTPETKLIYSHLGNNADQDYDSHVGNDPGISAIELAVSRGHIELVNELLTLGANVNESRCESSGNMGKYWNPQGKPGINEAVKFVIGTKKSTRSLLCIAILNKDLEMIELLLTHGADINGCYEYKEHRILGKEFHIFKNAFEIAVEQESDELLSRLIYLEATRRGLADVVNEESVEELVPLFKMHIKNQLGWPPLHYALFQNDLKAFRIFLDLRMDPEFQGNAPKSLVEMALDHTNPWFIYYLSQH